jgi:hypothetical protein
MSLIAEKRKRLSTVNGANMVAPSLQARYWVWD